jgi:hypothetical protein
MLMIFLIICEYYRSEMDIDQINPNRIHWTIAIHKIYNWKRFSRSYPYLGLTIHQEEETAFPGRPKAYISGHHISPSTWIQIIKLQLSNRLHTYPISRKARVPEAETISNILHNNLYHNIHPLTTNKTQVNQITNMPHPHAVERKKDYKILP